MKNSLYIWKSDCEWVLIITLYLDFLSLSVFFYFICNQDFHYSCVFGANWLTLASHLQPPKTDVHVRFSWDYTGLFRIGLCLSCWFFGIVGLFFCLFRLGFVCGLFPARPRESCSWGRTGEPPTSVSSGMPSMLASHQGYWYTKEDRVRFGLSVE